MGHFGREGTLKEKGHFQRSCFHFERREGYFEGVGTLGGHHGMEGHFERKGGHFEGMGQLVKALASLGSLFFHNILRMVILVPKNLWFLHHIQGMPVHSMTLLILKLVGQALRRIRHSKSICRSLPKSVCFFWVEPTSKRVVKGRNR